MESSVWLISASLLWYSTVYLLQKHFLVKWVCRHCLSRLVQLECDVEDKAGISGHQGEGRDRRREGGKKLVTDGDVSKIAMENASTMNALFIGLASLFVAFETRHDTMFSRSSMLAPMCHIGRWFFLVDTFAIYDCFRAKVNSSNLSLKQQCVKFVKTKWSYLLHHFILITVGYEIAVNGSIRNYRGDFYIGVITAMELSTPFVNTSKVMKILGLESSAFYFVNGFLAVVAWFVFRILKVPFMVLVYAAQYHSWDIYRALLHMRLVCYVSILLNLTMQIYWFMLVRTAFSGLCKRRTDKKKML